MHNETDISNHKTAIPHSVSVDNREKMTIFGVNDVENFDEKVVSMNTSEGKLTVNGENLHIEKLNLDDGELIITGIISGMQYSDNITPSKGGFLSRLFG